LASAPGRSTLDASVMLGYYPCAVMELVIGVVYPVYGSFKTLQTKSKETDDTKWLPYWILFAIFSSSEFFLDFIFASWFPMWYEFKLLFVLWLQPTYFSGATMLYEKYLEPMIASKSEFIDEQADFVLKRTKNLSADDLTLLIDLVTTKGREIVGGVKPAASPPAAAAPAAPAAAPKAPPPSDDAQHEAPAAPADEAQQEKPEDPDTEVVESTEAEEEETKKGK